jgi:hypothetical protein
MDMIAEILEGLKKPGKTKTGLAKALGIDPSGVTAILKVGKNGKPRQIKAPEIEKIRAYFARPEKSSDRRVVPVGQEFEPDPLPSSQPSDAVCRRNVISTVHPYEPDLPNAMPVVSSALSAGPGQASPERVNTHKTGIAYSADAVLGEITLPRAISSSLSAAPTNRIHWFEVRGDSMEPTLSGGDWVGVNTMDLAIGQGGVFAMLDGNGEILVKRLRRLRGDDNSKVQIISDNPRQGVDTEDLSAITIFGRIVARISRVG